jgi:hypothetical protein
MTSIFTYSPAGATTVPATVKKIPGTTGWTEVGIISTPVIDPTSGTLYLVAETYESGQVMHRLHALEVSSGQEKLGGNATIAATYTLNGMTSTFRDLYQMNRPELMMPLVDGDAQARVKWSPIPSGKTEVEMTPNLGFILQAGTAQLLGGCAFYKAAEHRSAWAGQRPVPTQASAHERLLQRHQFLH